MDFVIGLIFWVLAALILFSGLMVVVVKNVIHAALWLIASFAAVAAFYFLLEAPFIGVVQVLVYTGAVSILVLFAIMLTRHTITEGQRQLFERWWVAAVVAFGLFAGVMTPTIWSPQLPAAEGQPNYWPQTDRSLEVDATQPQPEGVIAPSPIAGALEIGVAYMREYLVPFILSSVLLLTALLGAIIIAFEERTRRRRILTLAEEAELRRSLGGMGIDRPLQATAALPPGTSDAGTAERK